MGQNKIKTNFNGGTYLLILILVLVSVLTYCSNVVLPYSDSLGFWSKTGPHASTEQTINFFMMTVPALLICTIMAFAILKRVNSLRVLNYPLAFTILLISCFFNMHAFGLIYDLFLYLFFVPLVMLAIAIPAGFIYGLIKDYLDLSKIRQLRN